MSIRNRKARRAALGIAISVALQAPGAGAQTTQSSGPESAPIAEVRYRYEGVDDGGIDKRASANTLRLRLGYRWAFAPGWQLYADGERVQPLFGEHYNSTANGLTQYPVVADPKDTEINQAYLAYSGTPFGAAIGRQRLQIDNQRFFGNSGWRQNEQTFDALTTRYSVDGSGPIVRYVYLDRVLRVNGHDNPDPLLRAWDLKGHLVNVSQTLPLGVLTGYAYLVENRDIATLSTRTFGARWTGTKTLNTLTWAWTFEYAAQSDWKNNPASQQADYHLIEPSVAWRGVTFNAGWEVLGGNGNYGFATPYATLHAFNGWADRFLVTPKDGLDDRYAGACGKVGKIAWAAAWHDFHADRANQRYGAELDLSLTYAFNVHLSGLIKYANYQSDGFASDLRKFWVSFEYVY